MRRVFVCMVGLMLLSGSFVLAGQLMTMEDTLAIRSISGFTWAPDNDTLLFLVRDWDREKNRYVSHIYRTSRQDGGMAQLTRGESGESSPRVSPDGKNVAFVASRGENSKSQIWILPLAGGESYQLTKADNGASSFIWAPDSQSLAFITRDVPEDKKEREKKKKDKFDAVVVDRDYSWNHLWTIPLKDGEARRLTEGEYSVSGLQWSPDGKQIVFQVAYSGNQQSAWRHSDDRPDSDIYLVSVGGGQAENLTPGEGRASGPRWSPSGDRMSFSASPGITSGDKNDLMVMDIGSRRTMNLTKDNPNSMGSAEWSPDGKSLYFSQSLRAYTHVYRIPATGGASERVTSGMGSLRGYAISPNGAWLAFSKNEPSKTAELWIKSVSGSEEKKLTDLNPSFREFEIAETKVIRWNSPDGMEIEGILTLPLGYQEGRKYPLIVSIHGGPTGMSGHTFSTRNQLFAARGYAILQPNPRGSSGYGMDFLRANYKDWGGKDFHDDDMSGVDKVIDMGIADPDKLVVMGGSYGGFSTFWAVTQTNRFKAAIGHAAISDWYSFYGQTDIPAYLHWGFGGHPWETREVFEKYSPYNFAQNVTTPLMITHGEQDRRVPIAQAEQYYTLLKKLGKKVEFVRFPREGHGIREPNHVIDLFGRQLRWFDEHLGIMRPTTTTDESANP